jgi:hypothetical protein
MKINWQKILEHIIIIELYILLTILAFHKLFILGIDKWVIGDHGDAWQFIWNFWWVKKCIIEGKNIFYTDYLFYPRGTHLYFHTLNLTGIFSVLPLLFLTENFILIYNIAVLLAFILSGYFMYLFLGYFLKEKGMVNGSSKKVVCFLGGCMYAFSPYVVSKALGYFNLLSVQWFPLALLLTFTTIRKSTFKKVMLLTIILIALFFADFHYFYYYIIFIVFYVLFNLKKIRPKNFIGFLSSIFFTSIILSLIYLPAFSQYRKAKQEYVRDYFQTITIYNYFLPSPFTILYRLFPANFLSFYYLSGNYMWVDSVVYLGIGYLFLLSILLFYFIKENRKELKDLYFLFGVFLFSILIALGSSSTVSLLLNNLLRKTLPFFDLMPTPARHSFLALFSLILILSYLVSKIAFKFKKKSNLLIFFLVVLFLLEYFPFFYSSYYHVNMPQLIYSLSLSHENFSILNIPHQGNTQGMYLQTIHKKRILDGFVSRCDFDSTEILEKIKNFIVTNNTEKLQNLLKENKVKYIILNYNYLPGYNYDFQKLLEILEVNKLDSTEQIEVFEVIYS